MANTVVTGAWPECSVSDDAYDATWNGVTDVAPSKNTVYDKIEILIIDGGTW